MNSERLFKILEKSERLKSLYEQYFILDAITDIRLYEKVDITKTFQ